MASTSYGGLRRPDPPPSPIDSRVLFVVVTLALIGITVVYATTFHKGLALLKSHGLRAGLGLLALFLGSRLRYTNWNRKIKWGLLVGSAALLVITLCVGLVMGTARRWLGFSIVQLQPAEIAKYALLIWLAGYFEQVRRESRDGSLVHMLLIPLGVVGVIVGLTLAQPAVGTSFIIAVASLALFFVAGVRWWHLAITVALAVVVFVVAITLIPYPRKRWQNFVSGERYHQNQSLIAIGSGGPFGKGLGEGQQKFLFLPKMHNDFIFAQVGEEFGFIGGLAIYFLYLLFLVHGFRISRESPEPFGQLLASGITVTIFLYAMVHVAVTLGVIPTTGQPLPFVSFGGSALVTNLFAAGVLLNISRFLRTRPVVRDSVMNRSRGGLPGGRPRPHRHRVVLHGRLNGGRP